MTAAPNLIPFQPLTVTEWIKTALNNPELPPTTSIHLNGYGDNAMVKEAIESLAIAHKQGGAKGAKVAWDEHIAKVIPDIAEIVNRPRRLWHIDELANRPPQQWLIPGKILENGLTTIFGASEAGKSFLAVDYAALISLQKPVVYIAGEGQSGYYARYKAWIEHFGYKKSGKFFLFEDAVPMLDPHAVESFIDEIRPIKPALIVVDTLIRCFLGGDENQSKDINAFTASCDRLRKEFGCSVVIIHHVTKSSGTERGSGALRNNCDTMIEVVNEEGTIKVICSKMKDGKHWPTEYYRRLEVEIEQNGEKVSTCVLEPWQNVKVNAEELTHNQAAVIEVLASEAYFDCGARSAEITAVTNIARSTLFSVLKSLMRRGFVKKPPRKSDPYFITESGLALYRRKGLGTNQP